MTTPTRDIDESSPRISSVEEMAEHLASGCKPKSDWRIGTEHEKFGYLTDTFAPLPYAGERSVRALLDGLADRAGWTPIVEGEYVIGLKKDGASVSLEPGGQFELSGAPLASVHETCAEISRHQDELAGLSEELGIGFFATGFSPIWSMDETPVMPKGRYGIMKRYMRKVGRLGHEMMFRTCTVQSNLDFSSESDMVRKMRVAIALQPIVTALYANSPFAEGRTNGYQSYRAHIWSDTDPDRTGMLPFVFEDGFGFERYVEYALDVPMYFLRRGGVYVDCAGQSFRDFMKGELPAAPGERPSMDDFDDHLSTIFPEVRLKTFLEMRGADAGPKSKLCALSAFWAGLLYDEVALDAGWELVKSWSWRDREALRRSAPAMGLDALVCGRTARDVAVDVLKIVRAGLGRRNMRNWENNNETIFIGELEEIAESGRSASSQLLDLYKGEWGGDLRRAFEVCRF